MTTAALTRFREALSSTFDSRFPTQFECISGEDEGRWELSAAQTIWGADTSAMFGVDGAFVGLLSGGGTTMQIGSAENGPAASYSFSTMWDPMDETKGAAPEAWRDPAIWSAWESKLVDDINAAFPEGTWKFAGCFVGTACNKQAVAAAGFSDRAVTAQQAVPLLRAAIAEFMFEKGPNWDREKDQVHRARYNWFRVMSLQMSRLAHVLEKMFEPTAHLYFTKEGLSRPGLDCEWTLGAWMERVDGVND